MEIFPAIDLLGGSVVRLTKGDYESKEVFSNNPSEVLNEFKLSGATNLHLVDLDGAKDGTIHNFNVIKELALRGDFFIEVGGGIRNEDRILSYLDLGVSRVILGTIAVENFKFVEKMVSKYGKKIAVGVDAKNAKVAVDGWKTVTELCSFDFCQRCADVGVETIIYTDIATDGAMSGTNLEAFNCLSKIKNLNIIASGGISYESELYELKRLNTSGAILGKALYKGLLNLRRAIAIGRGDI
ncbi:MAG: 1-(5-phosphoribosyl)-5-[(5-phosphoribosylamino)methylideneamino]imidazole-4-carboxamide isomerase [Clostridia bacterium]